MEKPTHELAGWGHGADPEGPDVRPGIIVPLVGADGERLTFTEGETVHYRFDWTAPAAPVARLVPPPAPLPWHVSAREDVREWVADVGDAVRGQVRRRGDWY